MHVMRFGTHAALSVRIGCTLSMDWETEVMSFALVVSIVKIDLHSLLLYAPNNNNNCRLLLRYVCVIAEQNVKTALCSSLR